MSNSFTTPDLDDQSLEEMCAELRKAGMNVTAKGVATHLNRKFNEQFVEAMRIQTLAAKIQGERRVMRVGRQAVGEVTMQIHPTLRAAIVRRFGAEAMKDDTFVRELLKSHEVLRVKSRSDKLTIVRPEYAGNSATNSRPGVHGKRGRWAR